MRAKQAERRQYPVKSSKMTPNPIWSIHIDAAVRPSEGGAAAAAILRDERGQICAWLQQHLAQPITNNEAEYAAAILALEFLLKLPRRKRPRRLEIYSDSQILVTQMNGLAAARSPALRQAQACLRALAIQFRQVSFHHIGREQNRLADALAAEVLAVSNTPQSYNISRNRI